MKQLCLSKANILFIELIKNATNNRNISSYLIYKRKNKTEEYFGNLMSHSTKSAIGHFVNNIEIANYVLENNIMDKHNLLIGVSGNGHLEVVKYLLSLNASINSLALRRAAEYGYLDVVKYLLDHGADIKVCNDYILKRIAVNRHQEVLDYITKLQEKNI